MVLKHFFVMVFTFSFLFLLSTVHSELSTQNGWLNVDGKMIWGLGQHNGWWNNYRANITRNDGTNIGPNRTEDLDKLTDAMLKYGYPAFEHCYGLWYDRRRDDHTTGCRGDANVQGPFLELPWARSTEGTACDGLPKYDLTKYNDWYFDRLKAFADYCDKKGTVMLHNFYMQHNLLETNAHYADFPWRSGNSIQNTGMPSSNPAANAFYDTTNTARNELQRAYIRKCLNTLGDYHNVIHLVSEEYTGGAAFMKFWLNTVRAWEKETGKTVKIGLGCTKNVMDVFEDDPDIFLIDLRYFWYEKNGNLYAPAGGTEVPGRYTQVGTINSSTSAEQIYRQTKEYRDAHPDAAIVHGFNPDRKLLWSFLMGGGSLAISSLQYPNASSSNPYPTSSYVATKGWDQVQHTYEFIVNNLHVDFLNLKTSDKIKANTDNIWCLADSGVNYLVYSTYGREIELDLSGDPAEFDAKWLDPRTGALTDANGGKVTGGNTIKLSPPGGDDYALWLNNPNVVTTQNPTLTPQQNISFSQNPGSGNFIISFPESFLSPSVIISDLTGKTIAQFNHVQNARVTWKTEGIQPGVYMIQVRTEKKSLFRKILLVGK
ncbi:MAG: T9SS type A sorting domain-containing protein [Fibrobacteria bacterium]|nr:T9SS type A sorting domain-containing protein [Fibrobacteria bacterium]